MVLTPSVKCFDGNLCSITYQLKMDTLFMSKILTSKKPLSKILVLNMSISKMLMPTPIFCNANLGRKPSLSLISTFWVCPVSS